MKRDDETSSSHVMVRRPTSEEIERSIRRARRMRAEMMHRYLSRLVACIWRALSSAVRRASPRRARRTSQQPR